MHPTNVYVCCNGKADWRHAQASFREPDMGVSFTNILCMDFAQWFMLVSPLLRSHWSALPSATNTYVQFIAHTKATGAN